MLDGQIFSIKYLPFAVGTHIMGGVLAMLPKYFIFHEAASSYFFVQLLSEILSRLKFL
jgi:hypothetical protein